MGRRMIERFTVSFFGHRCVENMAEIESRINGLINSLLREKKYVEFLVGRDGEFDHIVSSAIRQCKRLVRDDNSAHVWVLPYLTAELRENEASLRDYYDEIEISDAASGAHFKNAHQIRNREMVDRSDLVVFCIQHESGGAWQTMKYARKLDVPYINISASLEDEK